MTPPSSLYHHWLETVAQDPQKVLITAAKSGQTWTANTLQQAVIELDQALPSTPSWTGKIVILPLPNGADWLITFLLCLHRGAIPLPIDPETPSALLDHLVNLFQPIALRTPERFEHFPDPQHYAGAHLVKLIAGPDGQPQGLFFADHHLLADLANIHSSMALSPTDPHYALIPMGHSYGLGNLVLPLIVHGIPAILASDFYPSAIAADCARFQPTLFPAIPTLIRALTRSQVDPAAFASLTRIISAGDHLLPADAQAFLEKFAVPTHNFYGTSETGGISYDRTGEATLTGRSAGTPLPSVSLSLHPQGRLAVSSPATPGPHPFLTADYAELLPNAEVKLTDRTPQLLKLSGRRLHPLEVENALRSLPAIQHSRLETYTDSFGELRTRLSYQGDLSPQQVRAFLSTVIARWKIPHRITPITTPPARNTPP